MTYSLIGISRKNFQPRVGCPMLGTTDQRFWPISKLFGRKLHVNLPRYPVNFGQGTTPYKNSVGI